MKRFILTLCVCFVSVGVFAGAWSYHGPRNKVMTLIITANYKQPRLIAELVQLESRQPYLLIPVHGEGSVFFCPGDSRKKALEIRESDVERFIRFLNPKEVIVLGDEQCVPSRYYAGLDKYIPVVKVGSADWQLVANNLERMFGLNNLSRNYRNLSPKLVGGALYKPSAQPVHPVRVHSPIEAPVVESELSTVPAKTGVEEVKVEAKAEKKAECKKKANPEAKADDVKAEVKVEAKPEAKVEVKPEIKAEIKPEAKVETKAEVKVEAKPETKSASKEMPQAIIQPELLD